MVQFLFLRSDPSSAQEAIPVPADGWCGVFPVRSKDRATHGCAKFERESRPSFDSLFYLPTRRTFQTFAGL